ncbi:outer membrane protein assembly factor BamE [Marinobacter subterrani]|uniref:outer membrane protein assembly factor BamE n=1 Tax=Marinobacter subterrani TaxID=1658765 RepID=UPI002356AE1D|nr:outer membrane protein assembly factor BamE [Marinobacter subterrani]
MKYSPHLTALLLVIGLSAAGCSAQPETVTKSPQIASAKSTETRGTYVTDAQLAAIEAGDSQADVINLIGEPQHKMQLPPTKETWSYEFVEIRNGAVIRNSNVIVEFDANKRVTRAYRETIARAAE